jgi:hypothetical protein
MLAEPTLSVELRIITTLSVRAQLAILETHLSTANLNQLQDQKLHPDQEAVIQTLVDPIPYAKLLVHVRCVTVSRDTLENHQTVDQNVHLVHNVT